MWNDYVDGQSFFVTVFCTETGCNEKIYTLPFLVRRSNNIHQILKFHKGFILFLVIFKTSLFHFSYDGDE